ncbi:Lrp/AsnC family transcriptional regulator [Candidatus Woesearchaeota archaeon]|jgi:DNA-binding Lrp family transcriptional regulator|nr:Lrp/AsnC family transcriptional regulator [Candidatus Woesearchaeota archaeon]
MKEKERLIISHLRKNSRKSLGSISESIDMPISTIYDKINRFNKERIIQKFTALIDFKKLGYHHHTKLALQVSRLQKQSLQEFLTNHQAINSIHEINGGFDFMVETIHKDIKEYLNFIDELDEAFDITEKQEYQIINEIKKENFV